MATLAERGFTPLDGVSSEADKVYHALLDIAPGNFMTYPDLDRVLGREFRINRTPMYTALRRVEKYHNISFRNVPKLGFQRISEGEQLVDHVKDARRSAKRQTDKAIRRSEARTDVAITPQVQQQLDRLNTSLKTVKSALVAQGKRLTTLERKVERTTKSQLTRADVKQMIEEAVKGQ